MTDLAGLKVLIVEDEGAVALMIEDMLLELGCEVAASVANLDTARRTAAALQCDFAVLDVNVGGQLVFPVAQILQERQIPFLFSTGYGASGLPGEFKDRAVLSKPFSMEELQQKILIALHSGQARDGNLARS